MANPSISLPDSMVEEIDDRRHSTHPRSDWIQAAIALRLALEDAGEWENTLRTYDVYQTPEQQP